MHMLSFHTVKFTSHVLYGLCLLCLVEEILPNLKFMKTFAYILF